MFCPLPADELPAAEGRCAHAAGADDHLGDHLVHCHGGTQMSGTCVRNSQHIKGCLYAAVLAVFAVQSDKYDICRRTEFDDVFSEF